MDKKKVMIVDDEEDFLKITKLNLEEEGKYDVLTFSSAKEIISELHKYNPDVILLDIRMPKVGGVDACEMLSNDPIGKKTPLILVISTWDANLSKLESYKHKLRIADRMSKPIETDFLIASIEKILRPK